MSFGALIQAFFNIGRQKTKPQAQNSSQKLNLRHFPPFKRNSKETQKKLNLEKKI